MKIKLEKVTDHIEEDLKDPYFKEMHELEQQKLTLVKKIIKYRIDNSMTQSELADKIGVTQQHISKIENCEFTEPGTLLKVLLYIGFRLSLKAERIKPGKQKVIRRAIRDKAMA
jgi:DNA-binding XRE family transcriptional regulator